ncbi:MAG: TonB-dependent receptor [Sphingomicrobium sp.]
MIVWVAAAVAAQLATADSIASQPQSSTDTDTIIVTGTRFSGLHAKDSADPVQIVSAGALRQAGSPDLNDALSSIVASFNTQAVGNDLANETLAARLRGLSPNHTLVLINGKRLHGTANLSILSSSFQGGAAPDLHFIPLSSIARIEVLLDGAAAQYGSDAVAGVINIILNSASSGGSAQVYAGQYFQGDGETVGASANAGLALGRSGFLNLTVEHRFHDYSNAGGRDQRVERAIASGEHPEWRDLNGYPRVNKVFGDARYTLDILAANAAYPLGGNLELYAFGTAGRKNAGGFANFRLPTRLPQLYPDGFTPIDRLKSTDYSMNLGVRGDLGGWTWDLSTSYGLNHNRVEVTNSANVDLFVDTGATPPDFYNGGFRASQWTSNLDVSRQFATALGFPVGVAGGFEYRRETYALRAGDEASRYKAGSQSFPGFSLTDASSHSRRNHAAYVDLNLMPQPDLTIDVAARYENYSDFGDTVVGKLSARKAFSPAFALRGTASTGFRAPTLAEGYYSATNVQPNSAFVQLSPNTPAAALIGIKPLSPEHSRNFSVGVVATPSRRTSLTIDAYQISLRDRVVGSGTLYGTYAGVVRSDSVNQAIIANGNVLEAVPFSGINVFSNGLDTRTRGVDIVFNFKTSIGRAGGIDWSLIGNYNKTKVTRIRATPPQIAASGQQLFDKVAISNLETASPRYKFILSGTYRAARWTLSAKENLFGNASRYADPGDGRFYLDQTGVKLTTDVFLEYEATKHVSVSIGANNLFDVRPNRVNGTGLRVAALAGDPAVEIYPKYSPYGINGGYYFVRAQFRL